MPTIYTGKKNITETPKEQKKKVKVPTPEEINAKVVEAIAAQQPSPADKIGGGMSIQQPGRPGVLYPNVQTGQLKPEFQKTENIARSAEELGNLPESERITPINQLPEQPVLQGLAPIGQGKNPIEELMATARGFLRAIPIKSRQLTGGINIKDDTTIPESNQLMKTALATFKMNPTDENAINAMNVIQITEHALIQQRGYAKITAKAESFITGDLSNYEYELEQQIITTNNYRQFIADALRTQNNINIQAQTRNYRPGAGGR